MCESRCSGCGRFCRSTTAARTYVNVWKKTLFTHQFVDAHDVDALTHVIAERRATNGPATSSALTPTCPRS